MDILSNAKIQVRVLFKRSPDSPIEAGYIQDACNRWIEVILKDGTVKNYIPSELRRERVISRSEQRLLDHYLVSEASSDELALHLGLSKSTVQKQFCTLIKKLKVENRRELMAPSKPWAITNASGKVFYWST